VSDVELIYPAVLPPNAVGCSAAFALMTVKEESADRPVHRLFTNMITCGRPQEEFLRHTARYGPLNSAPGPPAPYASSYTEDVYAARDVIRQSAVASGPLQARSWSREYIFSSVMVKERSHKNGRN